MPRHLSLVAYNTPPTPASQDHSSCETFASTPLRLNSPLFLSYVGPQSPLVRPRASRPPPLYSLLCSLVNRLIAHASLRRRFMIERRFRHTSTRGSVAPRRTSNRRFIGDCIHSSLLRRGATEPPDSLSPPLHVLHVLHGKPLCALCASAPLR